MNTDSLSIDLHLRAESIGRGFRGDVFPLEVGPLPSTRPAADKA